MLFPLRAKSFGPLRRTNARGLFRGHPKIGHRLVKDYAFNRIKLSLPRSPLECSHRGLVTRLSAHADSGGTEIGIFGVVFVFKARSQKTHNVHLRHAPIAGQFAHRLALAYIIRNMPNQLTNHMAQSMGLLLPGDVACDAARVLNVLLTMENFPD